MKVRELIADATFTPGADFDSEPAPRVTVLLPTFRRGDNGLLERALDSLLAQTFSDLEVIVVDDASTDSTADVIARAMHRDPRVSVIRHARNVGLPAISEYEGFVRARGELICFAFDDTVFLPHAIEQLVGAHEEHPDSLIAAQVAFFLRSRLDGSLSRHILGRDAKVSDLLTTNVIANSGVLVPRRILDVVGLYDPHISMTRLCDYDLWLRIRRRFPVHFVDACIGEEHGAIESDSLGATYPLDKWLADDRMRQERTSALSAANFLDLEVFDEDAFSSTRSREAVRDIAWRHCERRTWMSVDGQHSSARAGEDPVIRMLVLAKPVSASTQLIFEGLRESQAIHVRFADPTVASLSDVALADVLVAAREVNGHQDWIAAADHLGTPVYFYLDDNLPRMAEAGELPDVFAREFEIDHLRAQVRRFAGVLTSTELLAQDLRDQELHENIWALDINAPSRFAHGIAHAGAVPTSRPTFAVVVGLHRREHFERVLWPALMAASARCEHGIVVALPADFVENLPQRQPASSIEIVSFERSHDYFYAALTLSRIGIDAVVIPGTATLNSAFKTVHPLLTASLLGAHLIAPSDAPYLEIEALGGVSLVSEPDHVGSWTSVFEDHLGRWSRSHPHAPIDALESLRARFDPAPVAENLREIVAPFVVGQPGHEGRRLASLVDWTSQQWMAAREQSRLDVKRERARILERPLEVIADLHDGLRQSRRVNMLRGAPTPITVPRGFLRGDPRWRLRAHEHLEWGLPLETSGYTEFPVEIEEGWLTGVTLATFADAIPGDYLGLEIVDPHDNIVISHPAAIDAGVDVQLVQFTFSRVRIATTGTHRVRVFTNSPHIVSLVEAVDRGRWKHRRPRARLLIALER